MNLLFLQIALSVALGAIFTSSSIPKLRHPRTFTLTVLEYQILPPGLAHTYSRLLPPLELLTGMLLLTGTAIRLAASLSATLLASFMVGVTVNLNRGRSFDCGCHGSSKRQISRAVLAQDGVLAVGATALGILSAAWIAPAAWSPIHNVPEGLGSSPVPIGVCLIATLAFAIATSKNTALATKRRSTS
jgi:hypothetical protein